MELFLLRCLNLFLDAVKGLHTLQGVLVWIGHWLGRFLVVAIFLLAVIAVSQEVTVILGLSIFSEDHVVLKLVALFSKQSAWIAATAIVATTVAMGHFRTLDINLEKAISDTKEKIKNEREK